MRLHIRHETRYRYATPPRRIVQLLRATPSSFDGHSVTGWRIDVDCDARLREGRDGYGNPVHMLYIDRPPADVRVTVAGQVLTDPGTGLVRGLAEPLPPPAFLRETPLTHADAALTDLAHAVRATGGEALDQLHRLNTGLHARLTFETGRTGVDTAAADAFAAGRGVCQDFTHIFLAAARALGIPARYVSGHLFRRDGAERQAAAHAWGEAHVPDLGWVGFDPSNGISPDDAYVRVACGLDYLDAAPVSGTRTGGGEETLSVEVRVARVQRQSQSMGGRSQSRSQGQN